MAMSVTLYGSAPVTSASVLKPPAKSASMPCGMVMTKGMVGSQILRPIYRGTAKFVACFLFPY
jgi:hypothetical protein